VEASVTERHDQLRRQLASERHAFARPLRALIGRSPVVCDETASIAEVARIMRNQDVGSVVLHDAQRRPSGIITTRDLVAIVAQGGVERPAAAVMSRDLVSLSPQAFAYEAALTMSARGIRHVLVVEQDRLIGVISERDLFALQRLGLGELTMEIRLAADGEALKRLAGEIRRLGALLIEQGTAPEPLTLFISVLNDRLTQRLIETVRKRHDLGRISWSWLAFGSEGRFEQTFSTDQDNGLIFMVHEGGTPEQARARLVPFAREVNEALDRCGFPLCRGNVMASNPELCLTLEEWKAKMAGWIEVTAPKALLDAAICFDLRSLYGDESLVSALREWIASRVRAQPSFLRHLARAATDGRPALGGFGTFATFATEDAPGAAHTVNLKLNGARIFVDAARVLALAHGVRQTSTAERLRFVDAATEGRRAETGALIDAFHFIQGLRLRRQALAWMEAGGGHSAAEDLPNRIDPSQLNAFEQSALKEAFRQARLLQQRLEMEYQL
jgi:CBS domain-containing protein